jgi:MFS family permease
MASFHGLWSLAGFSGAVISILSISAALSPLIHFSIVCVASIILVFTSYKFTIPHDNDSGQSTSLFVKPDSKILLLGVIAFCTMLCEGAMADWSGVYFKKIVMAPASFTALGYVAFTSTMALGRFLGDGLVMKLGVKRMLQMSGTIITAGLLISVFYPYLFPATIGFLLVGFGVSSVVPIVYGLAGKSTTMSASTALAAVSSIGFLGFLIGPPVIGFIAQAISLRWSFTLIALLGFGISILAVKLKTNKSKAKNYNKNEDNEKKNSYSRGMPAALNVYNPIGSVRKNFVAFPEKTSISLENADHEIYEGRTKNGGYVAYPRK